MDEDEWSFLVLFFLIRNQCEGLIRDNEIFSQCTQTKTLECDYFIFFLKILIKEVVLNQRIILAQQVREMLANMS